MPIDTLGVVIAKNTLKFQVVQLVEPFHEVKQPKRGVVCFEFIYLKISTLKALTRFSCAQTNKPNLQDSMDF